MYLVTTEDEDGMEFGDPVTFDSEAAAREWAKSKLGLDEGINLYLYRCNMIAPLTDN